MKNLIKRILFGDPSGDRIIEGMYAHDYPSIIKDQIRQDYLKRWPSENEKKTPDSHPWLFDPCDPPQGWAYDPYYEIWLKINL